MAWEWVAPVVTGIVGVSGIAGTYLNGRRQVNLTVQLAREQLTQGRLERAYQEVQLMVERTARWEASAMPLNGRGQDVFPPPPDDAHALEAAALRLYWSPEVGELVKAWAAARNRFAVHVLSARGSESFRDEAWLAAPEMKQGLQDAADALVAQMSEELLTARPVRRWRWRPRLRGGSRLGLDGSGTASGLPGQA